MREKELVQCFKDSNYGYLKMQELMQKMALSDSSVRNLIKEFNRLNNNIQILNKRGAGYYLQANHMEDIEAYLQDTDRCEEIDYYDQGKRFEILLFYLLQSDTYITLEYLETRTKTSRSTVISDLKKLETILDEHSLYLHKKAHYGIKIMGDEVDLRKAFTKYVMNSKIVQEWDDERKKTAENIDVKELENAFIMLLERYQLSMSDALLNNIMMHLKTLVIRAKHNNFVINDITKINRPDKVYMHLAEAMKENIENFCDVKLPEKEIFYLAAEISAKATTEKIQDTKQAEILRKILDTLGKEFLVDFNKDEELVTSLQLHLFPLINRLYYNMQLENPLIDEIYLNYANIFLIACRFKELIEKEYNFTLSRDEIGFVAMHFATYFERNERKQLNEIKRIVVICKTGGGSAQLIKLKLEGIFPNAVIKTISSRKINEYMYELPDLFLSTIPFEKEYENIPVIQIKEFLDEKEIEKIKKITSLQVGKGLTNTSILQINSLFRSELFQVIDEQDYIKVLENQANYMIQQGYADKEFTSSVIERENLFSTIYFKGVAGPHPMILNAIENTVGITILKKPILVKEKEVKLIFLINLKQDCLFLHKELSKLILRIIDHDLIRDQLFKCTTYSQFMCELEKIL